MDFTCGHCAYAHGAVRASSGTTRLALLRNHVLGLQRRGLSLLALATFFVGRGLNRISRALLALAALLAPTSSDERAEVASKGESEGAQAADDLFAVDAMESAEEEGGDEETDVVAFPEGILGSTQAQHIFFQTVVGLAVQGVVSGKFQSTPWVEMFAHECFCAILPRVLKAIEEMEMETTEDVVKAIRVVTNIASAEAYNFLLQKTGPLASGNDPEVGH